MVHPSERGIIRLEGWYYADGSLLHAGTLDVDKSGFVNGVDFDLFVRAFEEGWSVADYDGDGFVTGIDFDRFTADFAKGSP